MQKFWSREKLLFGAVFAGLMLLLPMAAVFARNYNFPVDTPKIDEDMPFYTVYDIASERNISVSVRDYLIGAVAAEMPASYEPEALRAQVIAAHTYAEYICAQNKASPNPDLHGADFSNDTAAYQGYYTEAQLHTLWGDDFARNYAKITDAVDAVGDYILCYDGAPIAAAFHAVSAGQTASAADIWGSAVPYLVSVPSEWDAQSMQFSTEVTLSEETVRRTIEKHLPALSLQNPPETWFQQEEGSFSLRLCGAEYANERIRELFSLPSPIFSVQYIGAEKVFCFRVQGLGHTVGMSQFGANAMAREGSSCSEILQHYYPSTVLTKLDCSTWNITGESA